MSLIYNNIVYIKLIDAQEFLIKRQNKHQKCSIRKSERKQQKLDVKNKRKRIKKQKEV